MVVRRRKKVTKYRGSTTYGGGHRKKRRGAGSRGGRGRAGRGKKGKGRKQMFEPLGKHGFFPGGKVRRKIRILNLSDLEELIKKHKIEEKNGFYQVDLDSLGYQKLLGTGRINFKLQIKVKKFSKQAEEKIKAAGGNLIPVSGRKSEEKEPGKEEPEEKGLPQEPEEEPEEEAEGEPEG